MPNSFVPSAKKEKEIIPVDFSSEEFAAWYISISGFNGVPISSYSSSVNSLRFSYVQNFCSFMSRKKYSVFF